MVVEGRKPVIEIRDVHKSFGRVRVLRGISLDVHQGEVVLIIGPSGSGKTTLIRLMGGLAEATRGLSPTTAIATVTRNGSTR